MRTVQSVNSVQIHHGPNTNDIMFVVSFIVRFFIIQEILKLKDKARCTLAGGHHLDDRADFDTGVQLAVNDAESVEPVGYGGDYRVALLAHCDSTVVN